MEDQKGGGSILFPFCERLPENPADGAKDRDLSTHPGEEGTSLFSVAAEDGLEFLFRLSFVSCPAFNTVILCVGNPIPGTVYIHERDSPEDGEFIAGSSWYETKPACL